MTHDPTRRTQRQREPKRIAFIADRHKASVVCNAVVARNGITEGTEDAVRAIGGGDLDQWDEEQGDE